MKKATTLCGALVVAFFVCAALPGTVRASTQWFPVDAHYGGTTGQYITLPVSSCTSAGTQHLDWLFGVSPDTSHVLNTSAGSCFVALVLPTATSTYGVGPYWVHWYNSGNGEDYFAQLQLNAAYSWILPLDWGAISFPLVYSSSTAALATSSGLWNSLELASTTVQCDSGNIFEDAMCASMSYLFTPNPTVLAGYGNLPTFIETRFPVSWAVGLQQAWSTGAASSSSNFIVVGMDFAGTGIGTSTAFGNFLPNATILSTSTIEKYITPGQWAYLQFLIAAGLWLTLGADIFFYVRNHMHRV